MNGSEERLRESADALAASGSGPPFLTRLTTSGVLAFSGSDARSFLHGQLANDVTSLPNGGSGRSLLLNHKGHAMAEAAVLRVGDEVLCVVDDDRLAWVKDTLERHIVFDDVRSVRRPAEVITVQGSSSGAALREAGLAVPAATDASTTTDLGAGATAVVYASKRSAAGGFDVLVLAESPAQAAAATAGGRGASEREAAGGQDPEAGLRRQADALGTRLTAAGALEVGPLALDAARVAAGVATAGREGGEGVLPQEAGLEPLISYRKGCYLGQEIMARIEARGTLRRELATIELAGVPDADKAGQPRAQDAEQAPDTAPAAASRAITASGKTVGLLGTVALMPDGAFRALCVLRRDIGSETDLSAAGSAARRLLGDATIMPA